MHTKLFERNIVHKAGFINIVGKPNVGKSTFMNAITGEDLAIITSKAQTTRHRILGIVNGDDFQMIFSDTPGMIKPAYKLQQDMMQFVNAALEDADVLLFMTDVKQKGKKIPEKIKNTDVPVFVLINKIDLADQETVERLVAHWEKEVPGARILPVSAIKKFGIEQVFNSILEVLPENPAFYPKEQLTDKPERFFVSEIIREKILMFYHKEIPYSCEVVVESFKEDDKIIRIRAEIIVARKSQKGIIIGHKGEKLKKTGTAARKDLESFFGKKVFLEQYVKVDKNWRDSEGKLKKYGYR